MSFRIDPSKTPEENLEAALEDGCVMWAEGYAEPGYDETEKGVLFADWNVETKYNRETGQYETVDDSMKKLSEMAEKLGYGIEGSDEWSTCGDCNKAYRTSPDSYGWTKYAAEVGGEEICGDCIIDDPEPLLDELSENHGRALPAALKDNIDITEYGWVEVDEDGFEVGYHRGQDDSYKAIGETLEAAGIEKFLFVIDGKGQFDVQFSVYVKEEELKKAQEALEKGKTTFESGMDPASCMERGLREAAKIEKSLPPGPGIKVMTIHGDGTATGRVISPEDFVSGKAFRKEEG